MARYTLSRVELDAVSTLPRYPNKCTVISLTQPTCHIVVFSANFWSFECDCPKFSEHVICAHTIAAAYSVEKLETLLVYYQPSLDQLVKNVVPKFENFEKRKKKNFEF